MNAVSVYHRSDYCSDGRIFSVDINSISPNPSQRHDFEGEAVTRLAESIRCYGILQPITVRSLPCDLQSAMASHGGDVLPAYDSAVNSCGRFELIAGGRRLSAARLVGLESIPCIVIRADDRRSAELALIENLRRADLNIFEQAGTIASLIDIGSLTQEQAAEQLSSSQSYIANKLRILRLTEPERRLILEHNLSERHARALLRLSMPNERLTALREIISRQLNVAASERYIDRLTAQKSDGRRQTLVLKDIRVLYNTIDKAVETVRNAGIDIGFVRRESADSVELVIAVPKHRQ